MMNPEHSHYYYYRHQFPKYSVEMKSLHHHHHNYHHLQTQASACYYFYQWYSLKVQSLVELVYYHQTHHWLRTLLTIPHIPVTIPHIPQNNQNPIIDLPAPELALQFKGRSCFHCHLK
jgi:hypothetical protein